MTVSVRFGTPWRLRELSIAVVHEQLRSTICEQSISPVDETMAEDLIVSCHSQWSEQLSCRWLVDESWCSDVTHVDERGTWQLCHVRRLAFPLNTSFYLMQHTPLWRSKFRILRIKKTRTKIGTLRISHTSLKLLRDIPSGSFTESDLRKIGAITDRCMTFADCRPQTADCRPQTADCRLQTADCRLQTADCRLLTADCRL